MNYCMINLLKGKCNPSRICCVILFTKKQTNKERKPRNMSGSLLCTVSLCRWFKTWDFCGTHRATVLDLDLLLFCKVTETVTKLLRLHVNTLK